MSSQDGADYQRWLHSQVMARRRGANLYNTRKWVYHLEQTVMSVWDTYLIKGARHTVVPKVPRYEQGCGAMLRFFPLKSMLVTHAVNRAAPLAPVAISTRRLERNNANPRAKRY